MRTKGGQTAKGERDPRGHQSLLLVQKATPVVTSGSVNFRVEYTGSFDQAFRCVDPVFMRHDHR